MEPLSGPADSPGEPGLQEPGGPAPRSTGSQSRGGEESCPLPLPTAGVQVQPIFTLSTQLALRPWKATEPVTRCHPGGILFTGPSGWKAAWHWLCSHPGSSPGQPRSASSLTEGHTLAWPSHRVLTGPTIPGALGVEGVASQLGGTGLRPYLGRWAGRWGCSQGPSSPNWAPCNCPQPHPSRSFSRCPVNSQASSFGPCWNMLSLLAHRESGQPRGDV